MNESQGKDRDHVACPVALRSRRSRAPRVVLVALAALSVAPGAGWAGEPDANDDDKVGTWRFRDESRPIKAIVLGGSVSAWLGGNFGDYLSAACPRVELVNEAKARLGANQLLHRLEKKVLRNRRLKLADYESTWLIFQGGLNSIGDPARTNRDVARIFAEAHRAGLRTVGLTVGPWGDQKDKRRWKWAKGLKYQDLTREAVDFVLGRLDPAAALGRYADRHEGDSWRPGELPDIAVDLYDSDLRDRDAEPLPEEPMRRYAKRDRWVKKKLAAAPESERETLFEALVKRAVEMPRWYLKRDYRAFDHIHPNTEGHRVIARTICPRLPAEWGCDCAAIAQMTWNARERTFEPRVGSAR